jgi:hypothetical protein
MHSTASTVSSSPSPSFSSSSFSSASSLSSNAVALIFAPTINANNASKPKKNLMPAPCANSSTSTKATLSSVGKKMSKQSATRPSSSDALSVSLKQNVRVELIQRVLNNNELALNSLQLINFIQFYFDDEQENSYNSCCLNNLSQSAVDLNQLYKQDYTNSEQLQLSSTCYPCMACSSEFSFEQTFQLHLERRTILARLYCSECASAKTFYNKCKLMYHIYSHKQRMFEPIYHQLSIECIPMDRLNATRERTVDLGPLSFNSNLALNEDHDLMNMIASILSTSSSAISTSSSNALKIDHSANGNSMQQDETEQVRIRLFLKQLLKNKFLLYKCRVCEAIFFSLIELREHFALSKRFETANSFARLKELHESSLIDRARLMSKLTNLFQFSSFNKKRKSSELGVSSPINNNNQRANQNISYLNELNNNNDNEVKKRKTKKNSIEIEQEFDELKHLNSFIDTLNSFSFSKLHYSTRCSMLAAMNLLNFNFEPYPISNGGASENSSFISLSPPSILICPECGLSFDKMGLFRIHLFNECVSSLFRSNSTISTVNCFICSKTIPNELMRTHLKTAHCLDAFCICPLCGLIKG